LYSYVLNDPLNFTDPNGLNPVAGALSGGAVAGPVGAIVGAVIGTAIGIYLGDKMFNDGGKVKDVPDRGTPGEWVDGKRRSRKYGPDGRPEIDIDKPHPGFPDDHVHEWPDGVREHPGRPVCPI
ncbi:hypothetical protein, partial [Endothiovibrio diazotrophicus]